VTAADRECERVIAGLLLEAFPDDGLLGEEGSLKEAHSGRRWIIDPIDGTRDFVRGIPTWAILIGLESAGEVVAGVAHLPAFGDTYSASRGAGAFRNSTPIRVSNVESPSRAVVCMDCLNRISHLPLAGRLVPWLAQFWAVRSLGGILDAMFVASGKAEAWLEPVAKAWDLAPIKVIAEEAGARFLNFDGGSSIYGGSCAVCAPGLEAEVRSFLGCGSQNTLSAP
jgi:histidinol-phosphatase